MRFIVTRTSAHSGVSPCKEAVAGAIQSWDRRTCRSPEEFDKSQGHREGTWFSWGTEHEIIRGSRGGAIGIRRRIGDRDGWFVDLDSIEDLVAFATTYGDLIVSDQWWQGDPTPAIEIYDDYRE